MTNKQRSAAVPPAIINTLTIVDGASAHVSAVVLDQYGNVMPGLDPTITDTAVDTTFTADAGVNGAGTLLAIDAGSDTLTATYGTLTPATLAITVTPAPSVATSLGFTSP